MQLINQTCVDLMFFQDFRPDPRQVLFSSFETGSITAI